MRLLPVLVVLAAAVAHAQAVRPAPATGPLIHQQPPSYPGATYTPPGAGASHGGIATPEKVLAPTSPNRRLLPPTSEAGIWAADRAPVAVARHHLWGVEITLPGGSVAHEAEKLAFRCSAEMEELAKVIGKHDVAAAYPDAARRCIVATLQRHCAIAEVVISRRKRVRAEELDRKRDDALAAMAPHTDALRTQWCTGVTLTNAQQHLVTTLQREWDIDAQNAESP